MTTREFLREGETSVFPRELDRSYPLIVRGEGSWLIGAGGRRYLDAISGGAMVTSIGHGITEIVEAARHQAEEISFIYNQQFTSPAQEQLAAEVIELAPPGFGRIHFTSGGAEANETALRLARLYHAERGDTSRWRIITQAQSYHGPTMGTFALTGRPAMTAPFDVYVNPHPHVRPSTWRWDPSGESALAELDQILEQHGDSIAAFMCEPVGAAALPAYRPPDLFWEGLRERADRYGFLIMLDEVVTGFGRTGSWFAADQLPISVDVISTAKGLGAGYAPVGGMICTDEVYGAFAEGSRNFEAGHTWDGAPLPCAVGTAVLAYIRRNDLIARVAGRAPKLHAHFREALDGCPMVKEVRGEGFLVGLDYVDPGDGRSFLPEDLRVGRRIDLAALERDVLIYSTQPTGDGIACDQTLIAPPFVATDAELEQMVERISAAVWNVAESVERELASAGTSA
jgi:adenosylmethionine-8-amino-7-oxononanoate aminotransferase